MSTLHPTADIQSALIGEGTTVWQYVVILPDAKIGKNCNINAHCFIENDVIIGDNVTLKCGVYLWDGIRIGNNVFIGPNVTFTNDKYPKSKEYPAEFQKVIIEDGASVGAGSVILGDIVIGRNAIIGAGSLVTKNVPEGQVWMGHPARFIRFV
ncbi:MAG: N-acetyltransferase [Bacteroidales bacterium]|nr:N-acetyltransferase [Bacteroidales bacterium]